MKSFAALILEEKQNKNDNIAIVDSNGARKTSWKEFRKKVFMISEYAKETDMSGIVPIYMERSADAYETILGLNLAGIGVAPISITTPIERCHHISHQLQNEIWSQDKFNNAISLIEKKAEYSVDWENVVSKDINDDEYYNKNAYVVFTSGSTGTPKGVLLSNYAIVGGITRAAGGDFFDYEENDIILQTASFSFIAMIADSLAALLIGCTVHILPEEFSGDNVFIKKYIDKYKITSLLMPPQLYRSFDNNENLKCVCIGGDRIINIAPKGHQLVGVYGMSEMAGFAFHFDINKAETNTPLGVPSTGIKEYVLDDNGNLCDEGELCVSGSVAHGYFNMEELNSQVFTPNPFSNEPGHKFLLHSGDIVKKIENGGYQFINRKDFMLKINGQRVEPGEIELAIQEFEGINSAIVKGFSDDEGRSFICAYYTCNKEIDIEKLKESLSHKLPHYMIPVVFERLDEMPMNENGKINRKMLKIPDTSCFREEYVPPETTEQEIICKGFQKALKIDSIGIKDDFFRLGGDSICALSVVKECGELGITTSDIISGKTPEMIALSLKENSFKKRLNESHNSKSKLCDSQMGVYLECMLSPDSLMYNIPVTLAISNPDKLSADTIKERIDQVIKSHPALYSHIENHNDEIYMIRDDFPKDGICVLSHNIAKIPKPFELNKGPLCRVFVEIIEDKIVIFMDMHHIVSDGTSVNILFKQICKALSGEAVPDEKIDSFSLYDEELKIINSDAHEESKKYFENLLSSVESDCELIPDYKSDAKNVYPTQKHCIEINISDIQEKLRKTDITSSTLFMGAFGYALAKMTGQNDCIFAACESGRKTAELENTVSMLVKTLPIVINIDENKTGIEYLQNLQNQFYQSIKNDSISFGALCRQYGINSDILFVYQSELMSGFDSGKIKGDIDIVETGNAFAKLNSSVWKIKDKFKIAIEYRSDLYSKETIERFGFIFQCAAKNLLNSAPMCKIPLISCNETELLNSFFGNSAPYNNKETFIDVFKRISTNFADKTAVVYKENRYTYSMVDEITDKLAIYIHNLGIKKNQTVAVMIPRCEYMAILSISIMKANAVYEPLDPNYPSERLSYMCQDADAKLLIADREFEGILKDYSGAVLYTDEIPAKIQDINPDEIISISKPSPNDTFVLLYTSGTTGKPKGCMINHKNLLAFITAHSKTMRLDSNCNLSFYSSYGFDAHMADLYPALANGCELHIIPDNIRLDFPVLKNYFEENNITHVIMTTQVARQFAVQYKNVKGLKCLGTGGEKLLPFEPSQNYRVVNLYGPTEGTICVTYFEVDKEYESIPIGKAMDNCRLYVIDSFGRRVPCGVPGELIICGPQVAQGYLNLKEKTDEVFIPNTFEENVPEDFSYCYKTGDIVRYLSDGNIEFIGRRDLQVKIRGFRIELSEIEKIIRCYPGITNATVITADINGTKCIHAYIVSNEKIDISDLNRFIKSEKPAYMVPAATMQIDSIPLTPNHKVDKRKLPPITKAVAENEESARSLTNLEQGIMELLQDILGNDSYPIERDFSELGITSITSIRLATQIYKKYGVHITSGEIIDGGTILSVENKIISVLMENRLSEDDKPKIINESYPLTQTQTGIYLDCLRAGIDAYNIPVLYQIPKNVDIDKLKASIKEAVKCHPSMLCHIISDQKGNVQIYPVKDMDFNVLEESIDKFPPQMTSFAFDESPLFNFRIINFKAEKYLFIEMHHIISDGTSISILLSDIEKKYEEDITEEEEYTIFDLIADEKSERSSHNLVAAKEYYSSVFKGISDDYLPCADVKGDTEASLFNGKLDIIPEDIVKYCNLFNITENIFFMGVFAIVLSKFTAHEDALFATIYNGRNDPRYERLVAMLVKTLPVYIQTNADATVGSFMDNLNKRIKNLKKYDIYSFAEAAHDFSINADVIFIYQGRIMPDFSLNGISPEQIEVENNTPKAELSVEIFDEGLSYSIKIEYNSGRYSEKFIETFADAYNFCVKNIMSANKLSDIEILSDSSFKKFRDFNDTDIEIPYFPVYRLIEKQAKLFPDKIAIISTSENNEKEKTRESISYSQFNKMGNSLARELSAKGITPKSNVGIISGRTKEAYIAQLGILKAGCAFLFLSPSYPDERITYIANDGELKAIVTTHTLAEDKKELLSSLNIPVIFADDIDINTDSKCLDIEAEPDDLAYLIYTSGSTGKPKGVMVTHRGIVNAANMNPKNTHINSYYTKVAAAITAFTFDASVIDSIISFTNGMTVCIATDNEIHNPFEFRKMCLENHVSGFVATPSFIMGLLDYQEFNDVILQMESIILGGESFPPKLYDKLFSINPKIKITNGYGPSETTIACTAKTLTSSKDITIGAPLNNYKIYVIDKQNHILPMGCLGELVILGEGVGRGYVKREDLTSKSFIKLLGMNAFKSGDLALINHESEIEFHGRIDNQVKLRGLRIELGEIENAINNCDYVNNSIVVLKGKENNQFLAAYFTADKSIDSKEIINSISKSLTEYMIPRVFMQLPEMPINANGKIDKKALPDIIEFKKEKSNKPAKDYTEQIICELYKEILELPEVFADDNFFENGGSSISASRAVMQLKAKGINIEYQDIFTYQTPEELAAFIKQKSSGNDSLRVGKIDFIKSDDPTDPALRDILRYNSLKYADAVERKPLGDVLLTGATGFLGIHVLMELIKKEKGHIYCLSRKSGFSTSEKHLNTFSEYYFDECFTENYRDRITIINSDIKSDKLVEQFADIKIDTIINCAASVKHFSSDESIMEINVKGIENMIKLAKNKDARLIQISTTSIPGAHTEESFKKQVKMYENQFFTIDDMDNKYCISKYEAELKMFEAIKSGMKGKVIRVGNLMGRYADGEFQINMHTNSFLKALKGFAAIGKYPISHCTERMEFSPVDCTAEAIVKLAGTNDIFTAFNANNRFSFDQMQLFNILGKCGIRINPVNDEEYYSDYYRMLGDNSVNEQLSALITNERPDIHTVDVDNQFTTNVLFRIGFMWPFDMESYIERKIIKLQTIGYFL